MALIKIPKEMGSTPGIVDNSNDTAITIDSSENVGIGITPSVKLEVNGGSDGSVVFSGRSDGGNGNNRRFNLIAYADGGGANYGGGLKIQTRSSTNVFSDAVLIDSSGNLLVGKTATAFGTAGIGLRGTVADFIRDGGTPINVNRLTNAGNLIDLHKDSVLVGSIGVYSSDRLFIGAGDTNITFKPSHDIFYPSTATGAARDNAIDLGDAGARFKDIYLSGGVNFSANANAGQRTSELLDDYEEGTWTPTIFAVGGGTVTGITVGEAYYTKVGRNVNVYTYISSINLAQLTTGTYICLGGLPFTCNGYSDFNFTYMRGGTTIRGGYAQSNSSYIYLCDGSGFEVQQGDNPTVTHLIGACAYMTNS